MRTPRALVPVGALVVLTLQACASATPVATPTSAAPTASAPTTSATPSPAKPGGTSPAATGSAASGDPILAGKRQVVIKPIPSAESVLAVDAKGRLNLTDGEAEHGLFVFTPVGDKFQIKTAKAGAGGEPSCMGVKNNGSQSLTIVAAACDTSRDGQLFTITRQKAKDSGRPTYAISNRSAFLQVSSKSGLIAEELGDAPLRTTFSFVDNGPSTLPSLD